MSQAFYRLYTEVDDVSKLNLVVRSPIAAAMTHRIELEIRAIEPDATPSEIGTLETVRFVTPRWD